MCFELTDIYLSAIKKMIVATSLENVDVPITKMDEDISGIAEWIFAAIADMQYSTRMVQDVIKANPNATRDKRLMKYEK